jgi:hypothetical protein
MAILLLRLALEPPLEFMTTNHQRRLIRFVDAY